MRERLKAQLEQDLGEELEERLHEKLKQQLNQEAKHVLSMVAVRRTLLLAAASTDLIFLRLRIRSPPTSSWAAARS